MRISELSRRSGVPLPTIKFYLREGLLPGGARTAPNQARYDEDHLARLRLIRIFTDIGGANLGAVRTILNAINDPYRPLHDLCSVVHRTLHTEQPTPPGDDEDGETREVREQVENYLDSLKWHIADDAPGRDVLANVMAALRRFGWDCDVNILDPYAAVADQLAKAEIDFIPDDVTRAEAAGTVVIGTMLFETALIAMRRLAQEHYSFLRFGTETPPEEEQEQEQE
jgi:DNA-binding transcriptional MerR regulator